MIVPYKSLTYYIRTIDIGETKDLETMAARFSVETFPGIYRPLESFLLKLADLYLFLGEKIPCLKWFKGESSIWKG